MRIKSFLTIYVIALFGIFAFFRSSSIELSKTWSWKLVPKRHCEHWRVSNSYLYIQRACDTYLPGSDVPQSAVYLVLKLLYLSECQGVKLLPHEIPETLDSIWQVWADEGPIFTSHLYMRHVKWTRLSIWQMHMYFQSLLGEEFDVSKLIKLLFNICFFVSNYLQLVTVPLALL